MDGKWEVGSGKGMEMENKELKRGGKGDGRDRRMERGARSTATKQCTQCKLVRHKDTYF